ncbi:MAG: DUF2341 domain-containing protein, partial [Calditrichia bacterium]|nr:DUF2341 domain-containing protein [Calditrichia bacterium]
ETTEETTEEQVEEVEESEATEELEEEIEVSPLTGAVISTETLEVEGVVSKENPFSYELLDGKTAEVKDSSRDIDLSVADGVAIVTTEYFEIEQGFGVDYLSEKTFKISINLDELNLTASQEGDLVVSLIYDDVEIVSASEAINIEGELEVPVIEQNLTEVNESVLVELNETMVNITEGEMNVSTIQYGAVLNKPVKWKKNIKLTRPLKNLSIEIPIEAENVSVYVISESEVIEEVEVEIINESVEVNESEAEEVVETQELEFVENLTSGDVNESEQLRTLITAEVISEDFVDSEFGFLAFFKNIFRTFTGMVVETEEEQEIKEVVIKENATEFEIEYETPGPVAFETNIPKGKRIVISSDIHYVNILAYTELPKEVSGDVIKFYWIVNDSRQEISVDKYDLNNNSLIDYIEWVVPHLSNQTYELIIEIIKAEHLDESRIFISDIYDYVKAQDGNWSEAINDGEYVRVTFEQELDETRDITIYARGNGSVEVYEENGSEIIVVIENITSENWYKVYLTGLNGTQDVFDLKVLGSVEFDYIVDPEWFNLSWDNRKNITINHSKVNGSQVNFPILINITDTDLRDDAQSDGDDIVFTDSDNSQLDHEIEFYNGTTGYLVAWVRIPTLSNTTDTVIHMYYGNAGASNQENASGVWDSNFVMVQHLSETPAGTTYDSTSYGNNGT